MASTPGRSHRPGRFAGFGWRRGDGGRGRPSAGARYSRWDGTQTGFELDADQLLEAMSDDLLQHGDVHAALRRLMRDGIDRPDGERLPGLREMLQRLAERRRRELARRDLGGVADDIAERLRDVVDRERRGIEQRERDARAGGPREAQAFAPVADDHRRRLDELPPDLAGMVEGLSEYPFVDDGAREQFEALVAELREQLLQSHLNRLSSGLRDLDEQKLGEIKDMLAELNAMLEQRARGEEPDFDGFMSRHGHLVPGSPRSLDELLEQMARAAARVQGLM